MRVTVLPGQTDVSKPSLGDLQTLLDSAMAEYREAEKRESIARQDTTAALNKVNDLQRKIDHAVALLKNYAPRSSDWKQTRGEPA